MLISDKYSWSQRDVAYAYLEESFDRNVKWIIKAHPKLAKVLQLYLCARLGVDIR